MSNSETALVPQENGEQKKGGVMAALMECAHTFEDRARAFQLATAYHQSQMIRQAAVAIAGTQWGDARNMTDVERAAIARWCLQAGIDPLRHIYVLGGRVYDNAELYIDALAADPNFSHATPTVIAPLDARKIPDDLPEEARKRLEVEQHRTNEERLRLQMKWAVPENVNDFPDTAAAVVITLHFKDGTRIEGCNWAGSRGRTYKKSGNPMDPVGDEEPVKTATTRAYRKAAKQRVPVWFRAGDSGDELARIEEVVRENRAELKRHGTASGYGPEHQLAPGVAIKAPVTSGHVTREPEYVQEGKPRAPIAHPQPIEDPYGQAAESPERQAGESDTWPDDEEEEARIRQEDMGLQ